MNTTRRNIIKALGLTISGSGLSSDLYSGAFGSKHENTDKIHSAFDPVSAEWDIKWPGRVSQYDLVYQSPPIDPLQGIPLGSGDVGALLWCEDSKIIVAVNKSDLWDDAAPGRFHNWSKEEEDRSTTLRHACRIIIDLKFPVFSTLYLTDFNGRLNLADASLALSAASPFGKVDLKAFVDHSTGNLFFDFKSDLNEGVPVDIAIERFGSRTFSHWYSLVNRDASIGLSGTETRVDADGAYVLQDLSGRNFSVGGSVVRDNGLDVSYEREHAHRASIHVGGKKQKEVQLAFGVTSPTEGDSFAVLKETLLDARAVGINAFRESNETAWKAIWYRSFMDYGDDYLNNLWHLTMYYANASQGGKYPGRFNNGLWAWSRDVQNWNFYFHWNQQQLYWPLNAAGHHDLIEPYLDFRFRSLPHARKDAREFFGSEGAFIADVTDRRGYNSANEKHNHTPVAEIALDFWRQYQYSGDEIFLKERALPFIIEAARYFESLFQKEEDGLYHAKEGSGYEGWILLKDGLTEIVYGKVLFSTAIAACKVAKLKVPDIARWKDIAANIAPLPIVTAGEKSIVATTSGYQLQRGRFKGTTISTDKIMAAGWGIKEKKWLTVYNPADDGKYSGFNLLDGIFPTVTSSPVFPSGLIGLSDKREKNGVFDSIKATTLLYPSGVTGWDPVPIVKARLGLSEALNEDLKRFPERWQIYCNGWGHWGMEGEIKKDAEWYFRTNQVKDTSAESRQFPIRVWPFRHMSMESMSVLAAAMNESVLQSHDGIIRIAPAFPGSSRGRFTLHAVGGFVVSAEIKAGTIAWVCVKSRRGGTCRLEVPWEEATAHSNKNKSGLLITAGLAAIKTDPDEVLMIIPKGSALNSWSLIREEQQPNGTVKYHSSGNAQLGLPRMF